MARRRAKHPAKAIVAAIQYAEDHRWEFKDSGQSSHAWGRLYCPLRTREGHQLSIWSTPRNADNHAKQIIKQVDKCHHEKN